MGCRSSEQFSTLTLPLLQRSGPLWSRFVAACASSIGSESGPSPAMGEVRSSADPMGLDERDALT